MKEDRKREAKQKKQEFFTNERRQNSLNLFAIFRIVFLPILIIYFIGVGEANGAEYCLKGSCKSLEWHTRGFEEYTGRGSALPKNEPFYCFDKHNCVFNFNENSGAENRKLDAALCIEGRCFNKEWPAVIKLRTSAEQSFNIINAGDEVTISWEVTGVGINRVRLMGAGYSAEARDVGQVDSFTERLYQGNSYLLIVDTESGDQLQRSVNVYTRPVIGDPKKPTHYVDPATDRATTWLTFDVAGRANISFGHRDPALDRIRIFSFSPGYFSQLCGIGGEMSAGGVDSFHVTYTLKFENYLEDERECFILAESEDGYSSRKDFKIEKRPKLPAELEFRLNNSVEGIQIDKGNSISLKYVGKYVSYGKIEGVTASGKRIFFIDNNNAALIGDYRGFETTIIPEETATFTAGAFGAGGADTHSILVVVKNPLPPIGECMMKGSLAKFGKFDTYLGAASCGLNTAMKGDFIGALGSAGGCMIGSMLAGAADGLKECGHDPNGDASCAIAGARLMSQVKLPKIIPSIPTPLGMVNFGGESISGALGNLCGAPAANACLLVPPPPLISLACGLAASVACQTVAMGAGSAIGVGLCKAGIPLGSNQDLVIGVLNTITAVVDNIEKLIDFVKDLPKKIGEIGEMIKKLFTDPKSVIPPPLPVVPPPPPVEPIAQIIQTVVNVIGSGCAPGGTGDICNRVIGAIAKKGIQCAIESGNPGERDATISELPPESQKRLQGSENITIKVPNTPKSVLTNDSDARNIRSLVDDSGLTEAAIETVPCRVINDGIDAIIKHLQK